RQNEKRTFVRNLSIFWNLLNRGYLGVPFVGFFSDNRYSYKGDSLMFFLIQVIFGYIFMLFLYDEDIILSILVHNCLRWDCINGRFIKAYICYYIHPINQTNFLTCNFGMYNDGFAIVFKGRSGGENTSRIPLFLIIGKVKIKFLTSFKTWKIFFIDI